MGSWFSCTHQCIQSHWRSNVSVKYHEQMQPTNKLRITTQQCRVKLHHYQTKNVGDNFNITSLVTNSMSIIWLWFIWFENHKYFVIFLMLSFVIRIWFCYSLLAMKFTCNSWCFIMIIKYKGGLRNTISIFKSTFPIASHLATCGLWLFLYLIISCPLHYGTLRKLILKGLPFILHNGHLYQMG